MRASYLSIAVAALGIMLVGMVGLSFGEDQLVIKRKDGTVQRVPLPFAPDEIESFQVEPSRRPAARPGEEPRPTTQPRPAPRIGEGERPPAPAEVTPRVPRPGVTRPPIEREEPKPTGPRAVEKPAPREARPPAERRPPAEPGITPGLGEFNVNVYKLPDNIRAIPEYSALRPVKIISGDRVDLQGAKGVTEPAGIPENTDGLGLRIMGTFKVTGEGIFRWRVNSKDGARLHVDDKTVTENDGVHEPSSKVGFIHLAEGVHTVMLDSFNSKGGPVLQLFVTPPVGQEEIFSINKGLAGWLEPAKPYDVLWGQVYFMPKGDYPKGPDFSKISPIGRTIAQELSLSAGAEFPGVPGRKDMLGVRYEGFFNVKGAGIFAFRLRTDDFAKLTIGNNAIAEVTGGLKSSPDGKIGWAFLQEGSYPMTVEYFHAKGDPTLQLFVTQPERQEEVFSPGVPLEGYASDTEQLHAIPAFVYFLKPNTRKMPNYNSLTPSGMFFTKAIDYPSDRGSREFPGVPKRDEWLGIRFYVKFSLTDQEQGEYKFRIVTDDAARLIVGKKLVVSAEGFGTVQEKTGTVTMAAGSHEMFLDYMQGTGPSGIQLYITPPGGDEKIFSFQ